jgi:hypothetical protein
MAHVSQHEALVESTADTSDDAASDGASIINLDDLVPSPLGIPVRPARVGSREPRLQHTPTSNLDEQDLFELGLQPPLEAAPLKWPVERMRLRFSAHSWHESRRWLGQRVAKLFSAQPRPRSRGDETEKLTRLCR